MIRILDLRPFFFACQVKIKAKNKSWSLMTNILDQRPFFAQNLGEISKIRQYFTDKMFIYSSPGKLPT